MTRRRVACGLLVAAAVASVGCACGAAGRAAARSRGGPSPGESSRSESSQSEPSPSAPASASGSLLRAAPGGDGDSWHDTGGREYRLGLVNTPEVGDCYGSEATARRRQLVAGGFRVVVYATDRYGRAVSEVMTADGRSVNVELARHGYADDRYLHALRGQRPALARELDAAFTAARGERAGLWGACR